MYGETSETFAEFLRVLTDFFNGATDTVLVMDRIAELFAESIELVFAFNAFLPDGYRLTAMPAQHMPYLTCEATPEATRALADDFLGRLCMQLQPYPQLLAPVLSAIDKFPSPDELRPVRSMDELMGLGVPQGVPVSGMTLDQAERIRGAAREMEMALNKLPETVRSVVRELMHFLPTGLHNGLADSVQGFTRFVRVPAIK